MSNPELENVGQAHIPEGTAPEPDNQEPSLQRLRENELALFASEHVRDSSVNLYRRLVENNDGPEVTGRQVAVEVVEIFNEIRGIDERCSRSTNLRNYLIGGLAEGREEQCPKKSDYMTWIRSELIPLLHRHEGCLGEEAIRQARKIYRMGQYSLDNLSVPKNSLLEAFYKMKQAPGVETHVDGTIKHPVMAEIEAQDQVPEEHNVRDDNSELARLRFDTHLTQFQFRIHANKELFNAVVTKQDCRLVAAFRHKAIEPGMVDDIAEKLTEHLADTPEDEWLDVAKRWWYRHLRGYMSTVANKRNQKTPAEKSELLIAQTTTNLRACIESEVLWSVLSANSKTADGLIELCEQVHEALEKLGVNVESVNGRRVA